MPLAKRTVGVALAVAAAAAAVPEPARAYEFEIEARTEAQGYQLRWFRFSEPDRLLNRRRFTQSLRLHLWDILAPPVDPGYPDRRKKGPFELTFTSSLRFNHDFGGFVRGETSYLLDETMVDEAAITAVPELHNEAMELDVLYAVLSARDLFGRLDVHLGRQLVVDTLDWHSFDGLTARVRTPWYVALEARGGLVVRDATILGSPTFEPDGTSSADCAVFDGDVWDEPPDFSERCAQRNELMPTVAFAVETDGLRRVHAKIAYRRAWSSTTDEVYPTGAPSSGINEERLSASVRGNFFRGGVIPFAAARWSFLLGLLDEAQAGVRLDLGQQSITPELAYSFPSFDGDSILNVFSSEPYADARVTYDVWPGRGRLRAYARAFVRRFTNSEELVMDGVAGESSVLAAGGHLGARWRASKGRLRADLFYEDGHGGLRAGGDLSGRWRLRRDLELEGRVTVIAFDEDSLEDLDGVTFGAQGGGRWQLAEGIALHLLVEENINRFYTSQLRIIGILDLAFVPEI